MLDKLMNDLAERYAKLGSNGWNARTASPYAKGVVCLLDNREDIFRFLEAARLSPDTNAVERYMRAVAVGRRSSFFKQTKECIDVLFRIRTLSETAKLNGIKNSAMWLNSFHRAFFQALRTNDAVG